MADRIGLEGPLVDIAHEYISFQVYLEAARAYPDCLELTEDLDKARRAMEIAWLERGQVDKPASGAEERQGANSAPFDPEIGWTTKDGW